MPLNASGNISLGGNVVGESVNLELLKAPTALVSLNDSDVRQLAIVDFGTIGLSDLQGKERYIYGQQEYVDAGTYSWECPNGVSSVSVVCVGGGGGGDAGDNLIGVGGGGAGGALAYRNNVPVISGTYYTIIVGAGGLGQITTNNVEVQFSSNGGASSAFECIAGGGVKGSRGTAQVSIGSLNAAGGTLGGIYDGGGEGGFGGTIDTSAYGFRPPGGGGAGGYSGRGGYGGRGQRVIGTPSTSASLGGDPGVYGSGAGGGGGAGYTSDFVDYRQGTGARGGGVGLYGKGSDGAGGIGGYTYPFPSPAGYARVDATIGGDGSADYGGSQLTREVSNYNSMGAGGAGGTGGQNRLAQPGLDGAVRIIWPGQLRQFPFSGTLNA